MADVLTFECPHCRREVDLQESQMDTSVQCPNCEKTFEAKSPLGRPVNQSAAPSDHDSPAKEADTVRGGEPVLKKLHPVVFRSHLLLSTIAMLIVVAALVGLVMALLGRTLLGMSGSVLLIVSLVALGLAALFMLYEWIQSIATTLIVTNERTIVKTGILSRQTNEVQHDDVRNIKCDQNIFERMFNYGDISLSSAGQDYMEIVAHDIPDPHSVIAIIRDHQ